MSVINIVIIEFALFMCKAQKCAPLLNENKCLFYQKISNESQLT